MRYPPAHQSGASSRSRDSPGLLSRRRRACGRGLPRLGRLEERWVPICDLHGLIDCVENLAAVLCSDALVKSIPEDRGCAADVTVGYASSPAHASCTRWARPASKTDCCISYSLLKARLVELAYRTCRTFSFFGSPYNWAACAAPFIFLLAHRPTRGV